MPESVKEQCGGLGLLHLAAAGGGFSAAAMTRPREIAGQPCSYYWKDLISPGEYQNTVRGFTLSADRRRLENWARTGRRMLDGGMNIPIVCDHSEKARDTLGRIIDFRMDKGVLKGLCQFIGTDAPAIAARNEVSIGVSEHFVDGQGREWGDAIIHVALTPVPVVPGQQPFVKAASRSTAGETDGGGILLLRPAKDARGASDGTDGKSERSDSMSKTLLPCSDECLAALHSHVPGLEHAPNAEKLSRLAQHLSSFKHSLRKLCDMPDPPPEAEGNSAGNDETALLSRLAEKLQSTESRAAQAEAKVLELSRQAAESNGARPAANPAAVDPELLRDRAELTEGRIDLALSRGELTPAIAHKLKGRIHAAGRPNVFLLSRSDELGMRPIDFILDLLAGQRLIPIGQELSGAQTLSRALPGDEPDAPDGDETELPFRTMAARHNLRVR